MLKLNRKGYLTIEIILASAIAFVIAFFLIDITMKLVDKTDNYYVDTVFMTDKALVTKNLKELIESDINECGKITKIECSSSNNNCTIVFEDETNGESQKKLIVDSDNNINYDNGKYTKKFDTKLSGAITMDGRVDGSYAYIYIKFTNIFEGNDYDIIIPIVNRKISNYYKVIIKRQLGSATETAVKTLSVNGGSNSSIVSVKGTEAYPTYDSISCTNGQTGSVTTTTSEEALNDCYSSCGSSSSSQVECGDECEEQYGNVSFDIAKVTVSNVTSDTVCTAKFSAPTVYYSVQIRKEVGGGASTLVETKSVASGGSYSTTVSGGNYYAVDSVSCTNSQTATVSETFSGVVVNAYFSITNVTNDTVCTIKMIS